MVLLRLIDEPADSSLVNLNHLCLSMQTLAKQGILGTYLRHCLSLQDFRERLKSRLGALIDIVDGKAIRLLHKTLHTFLERSVDWTSNLPTKFQLIYPNEVWFRLNCRTLTTSTLSQRLGLEQSVQLACILKENFQRAVTSGDLFEEVLSTERSEIVRTYSAKLNVLPDELMTELEGTFIAINDVWIPFMRGWKQPIFNELTLRVLTSEALCLHPTQIVWQGYPHYVCFCERGSVARLLDFVQLPGSERALLFCLSHGHWQWCKPLLETHELQSPILWEGIHRWLLEEVMNEEDPDGLSLAYDRRRISAECGMNADQTSRMLRNSGEPFCKLFGNRASEYY